MGIVLDLSAYVEETADVRLADGNVLHLKKPTELMVIHMMQMKDIDENANPVEILTALNRITMEILNCNTDGVTFDYRTVSQMETGSKTAVVQAYSSWATQLQSNPTTSSPRSPEKKGTPRRSLRHRFTQWRNTRG